MRKLLSLALIISSLVFSSLLNAEPQHGIAMHGKLKYPPTFTHFDTVNPDAPKGGELKLAIVGTYDTLNPYILKGTAPAGLREFLFESLLKRSPEEPLSLYGLVAESLEVAPDRSWVIFNINPKAKWNDGTPLTAKDVAFSYRTFLEHGTPGQQMYYKKVEKVDILNDHKIKFTFKKIDGKYDAEMPIIIGVMGLIAEHDLKGKDFEKTGMTPLLSSGPYKVAKAEPGRMIIYQRDPSYWGADLPVNKGYFNFDTVRFDCYKNAAVAFEAFKAGDIYVREESDPGKWAQNYDFPALHKGLVKKVEIPHKHQVGMTAFVFNTRLEVFEDPRVRRALAYAVDFDWVNKNMFHGALTRTTSFFDNTELAAKGLPEGKELALLEPFRAQLPKEAFEQPYTLPTFEKGSRENLKIARELLKEAGWVTKGGKLVNEKTGKPFTFEILLNVPENEKLALALARNLKQLGVQVNVRTIDAAQYENRRVSMDFDMIIHFWGHSMSPGNEQSFYWSSKAADEPGTRNYPGVKSPVVDALCNSIVNAKEREDLVAAVKALDRTLLWGHYVIPSGHRTKDYVAYWNKVEHPPLGPLGLPSVHTLWAKKDEQKEL
ncbi:MAG: extracellular solute-binding protein [Alphaproteobacteria bacterium]|nr:extracellular solute-binding protein [Alphaproteobacteria bacterium]